MKINGKEYLLFERRGCEFWKDDKAREESDIWNYRITTPGEIVPGKDGRNYCFEFGCYDRHDIRKVNKRTGKPLKHPVNELTMTTATHIDSQFTDERGSWSNLEMEKEFYKTPRKYTRKNILDYVNSVSSVHYDGILWADCFEVERPTGQNWTPASLICEWASKSRLESWNTMDGIRVKLYSGVYKYLCFEVKHCGDVDRVTVYLEREEA